MMKSARAGSVALIVAATAGLAGAAPASAKDAGCPSAAKVMRDIDYVAKPVSSLQKLDLYLPATKKPCDALPVVVWVHGGGWRRGDKKAVQDKATFFNGLGYAFASINYRLSDPPSDPNRPVFPVHPQDVGAAIAYLQAKHADLPIDGKRIALLGHSAGGHLVALVGTDPTYINDAGGDANAVKCVIANDSEGYDVGERAAQGGIVKRLYDNAFGTDPAVQREASPINHVNDHKPLPDFLIITRGLPRRVAAAQTFADALTTAGGKAQVVDAKGYTHADVNKKLGGAGETVVTPPVKSFITSCLPTG
jgi:arylformamidase